MSAPRLVLLDFDGTLTNSDTFLDFIRFYHGWSRFLFGFLVMSPVLMAMKLKLVANDKVKEIVLRYFFGNEDVHLFNRRCIDFSNSIIPGLIKPSAFALLESERSLNSRLVIVSASPENWVKPWCDSQQIDCLATQLEVVDEKITGNIKGKNCYGPEKVRRIKEFLTPEKFSAVHAYGDSRGDREMLGLADKYFYRKL